MKFEGQRVPGPPLHPRKSDQGQKDNRARHRARVRPLPHPRGGEYRYDFGDSAGMTPLMKMHSLGPDFVPDPIHARGLCYHGMVRASRSRFAPKSCNTLQDAPHLRVPRARARPHEWTPSPSASWIASLLECCSHEPKASCPHPSPPAPWLIIRQD